MAFGSFWSVLSDWKEKSYQNVSRETFLSDWARKPYITNQQIHKPTDMAGPIDHQAAACAFPGSLTWGVEGPTLVGSTRCRAETVMPFNGYQTLQDSSDGRHDDRHDDFRGDGGDDDGGDAGPRYHGAWNDYAARRDAICGLRKPRMAQKR
jgi:hypothetical protein